MLAFPQGTGIGAGDAPSPGSGATSVRPLRAHHLDHVLVHVLQSLHLPAQGACVLGGGGGRSCGTVTAVPVPAHLRDVGGGDGEHGGLHVEGQVVVALVA